MAEKFEELIENARRHIRTADHLTYITYPLVKEKRLLLKVIDDIYLVMVNIVNAILQYDYVYKRIILYKNPQENFETFRRKSAPRLNITDDEIKSIVDVLRLVSEHKNSPMDFIRKEKLVIMSSNLHTAVVSVEMIKKFLSDAKSMLSKAEFIIKGRM